MVMNVIYKVSLKRAFTGNQQKGSMLSRAWGVNFGTYLRKWVVRGSYLTPALQQLRLINQSKVGLNLEVCRCAVFAPPAVRNFTNPAFMRISRCLSMDAGVSLQIPDSSFSVQGCSTNAFTIRRHWGADRACRFWEN